MQDEATKTPTNDHIHALIGKAAKVDDSADAMRFAQAAQNAAQALATLAGTRARLDD